MLLLIYNHFGLDVFINASNFSWHAFSFYFKMIIKFLFHKYNYCSYFSFSFIMLHLFPLRYEFWQSWELLHGCVYFWLATLKNTSLCNPDSEILPSYPFKEWAVVRKQPQLSLASNKWSFYLHLRIEIVERPYYVWISHIILVLFWVF